MKPRMVNKKGNKMKNATIAALAGAAVALATAAPGSTVPAAHIGETLDLKSQEGISLAVTFSKTINPATPTGGPPTEGPENGTYVATTLTIENTGTSALEGNVNNNTKLIGSDDQTYLPDYGNVSECTNFNYGSFELGPDESATGCVIFVLPNEVIPAKLEYTPSSGFANSVGEWLIL